MVGATALPAARTASATLCGPYLFCHARVISAPSGFALKIYSGQLFTSQMLVLFVCALVTPPPESAQCNGRKGHRQSRWQAKGRAGGGAEEGGVRDSQGNLCKL